MKEFNFLHFCKYFPLGLDEGERCDATNRSPLLLPSISLNPFLSLLIVNSHSPAEIMCCRDWSVGWATEKKKERDRKSKTTMHSLIVISIQTISQPLYRAQSLCHILTWTLATNRLAAKQCILCFLSAVLFWGQRHLNATQRRKGEGEEWRRVREGVGDGGDSARGNKHHHLSGFLTARSRQVEKGGGQAEPCVCVDLPFCVCVCTSKASSLLRDWHLSVDAWSRLYHAAAVRVCLNGVLLDAVPGQFPLRRSVIPTCIPLSVCYPHVICHSASLFSRPSLKHTLHLIAASTLCICLLSYQIHLASLSPPSRCSCMHCGNANIFTFFVPWGTYKLVENLKTHWNQSFVVATESNPNFYLMTVICLQLAGFFKYFKHTLPRRTKCMEAVIKLEKQ